MSQPTWADPAALGGLPALIAADRLGTYLQACAGDTARAMRLYCWNIEVAAFWGPLDTLEVAVRNAIHAGLTAHVGREDWWEILPLRYPQPDQVDSAVRAAKSNHGKSTTAGHIVAEFNLGFWTSLLANRYHAQLWPTALQDAFPYQPPAGRRGEIHARLEGLRLLRNRIAHHEPIFGRPLQKDHESILVVLGYLHPDARKRANTHSRVPTSLARRAGCVAGTLHTPSSALPLAALVDGGQEGAGHGDGFRVAGLAVVDEDGEGEVAAVADEP
jgi:hypothetical protein